MMTIKRELLEYLPINVINFKEDEDLEYINHILDDEIIFNEIVNNIKIKISISHLNKTNLENLQKNCIYNLTKFNIYFKVELEYEDTDISDLERQKFKSFLKKQVYFCLILSILDKNNFYQQRKNYCEYLMEAKSLQGVFLPFKFLSCEKSFQLYNDYYVADNMNSNNWSIKLEEENINIIKENLRKVFLENKNIKESTQEIFLQIHTLHWIKEGIFYTALVLLFSLWEAIIYEIHSKNLAGYMNLLEENSEIKKLFQKTKLARNKITHPNSNNMIYRNGKNYYFKHNGIEYMINIEDLEKIRQEIIVQINYYLN